MAAIAIPAVGSALEAAGMIPKVNSREIDLIINLSASFRKKPFNFEYFYLILAQKLYSCSIIG